MIRSCEWGGQLAGMVSEELEEPYAGAGASTPRGRYLLAFDPLDGSSNTDVNVSVGTIFSVLRHEQDARRPPPTTSQPGLRRWPPATRIYGPATMLVDQRRQRHARLHARSRNSANFMLTHPTCRCRPTPASSRSTLSNAASGSRRSRATSTSARPARRAACAAATSTCAGSPPWSPKCTASSCAAASSCTRSDTSDRDAGQARLRLLYEANPISMLMEQAGGRATTGSKRLMEVDAERPASAHPR